MKRSENKKIEHEWDFFTRMKEQEKIEWESKKKREEEEKERINKIPCPVCKSKEKHHHKKYENNGIIGLGSRGWLTEEYLICTSCGIHYSDINKPKL